MQEVITKYLTDNVKFVKIYNHTAAGTSTLTSDEVDARGYEGACFFTSFGTANAGNLITVHQSATTGTEAASLAHIESGTSDEDTIVDIIVNPSYPFLKLVATVGSSSTVESMWVVLYGSRFKSVTSMLSGTAIVAQFDQPALA
jgi:hypothetical protein